MEHFIAQSPDVLPSRDGAVGARRLSGASPGAGDGVDIVGEAEEACGREAEGMKTPVVRFTQSVPAIPGGRSEEAESSQSRSASAHKELLIAVVTAQAPKSERGASRRAQATSCLKIPRGRNEMTPRNLFLLVGGPVPHRLNSLLSKSRSRREAAEVKLDQSEQRTQTKGDRFDAAAPAPSRAETPTSRQVSRLLTIVS